MSDRITTVEDCILFFRAPEQPNDPATLRFVCGLGRQLADEVEALKAGHAQLRAALVALVGVDTIEELDAMEAFMRAAPAPAEDKAATIDAIHALKAVRP